MPSALHDASNASRGFSHAFAAGWRRNSQQNQHESTAQLAGNVASEALRSRRHSTQPRCAAAGRTAAKMAPRRYTGPLAAFWIFLLVAWGLNATAISMGVRTVLSRVGLCKKPTHMDFLQALMAFLQPVIVERGKPPSEEGCIVLCNHVNWADFVLDIVFLPRGVFVSRNALYIVFWPASFLRDWMFSDMIFFKRSKHVDSKAKQELYDRVADKCKGGRHVIVYAEGTRNNTGVQKPLKVGLIKLAYERKIPLYVSMVANKEAIVDEKRLSVTFGAEVRNAMSGLVKPGDHADFPSFLKAAQGAWDEVWGRTHNKS